MKLFPWIFIFILTCFLSCGSGADEKSRVAALQKSREDSIRKAVEAETRLRLELKLALEDSVRTYNIKLKELNNKITFLKADLLAGQDKLQTIRQPQFLRTPTEREQQIKEQALKISAIENELSAAQAELGTFYNMVEEWEMDLLRLKESKF